MYYSAVSIIVALILIIVNQDVLFKHDAAFKMPVFVAYKRFLIAVFVYNLTDVFWGVLQEFKLTRLLFFDTSLNYIAMAVGIWFWIGYIVSYYGKEKWLKYIFLNLGRFFTALVTVLVIINYFKPILFTISPTDGYTTAGSKIAIQFSQTIILLFLLLHSVSIVFVRYKITRHRIGIVALFCLTVASFIVTQALQSNLPFYSIAYLLGSCLLHFFVIEDEKENFMRETHEAAQQEILSASTTYENIIRMLSKEYFNLFYVDIETDEYIEYGSRNALDGKFSENRGADFFKTINKNVNKVVYEEDRKRLITELNRENVISEIEKKGSFGVYYRLVIEGEPVYVSLKATRVNGDDKHIIIGITNVDAQMKARLYAENAKEEKKAYLRLSAFSSNLLVLYVVDPETDEYTEFSATEDFEELGISKKGNNFFEEALKNSLKAVYSDDQSTFRSSFTKEKILAGIKLDGIFVMEYRLVIGGRPNYIRLKAAMIEEDGKNLLVIGIENVDNYVRREQKQAYELSLARELALKDALTGARNSYSFVQAKKQLNEQIENYEAKEFAIVICDINGLKEVNDTLGHRAGDELIKNASNRICNIFKHSRVYRIGGDEFAVICQENDYDNITELLAKMNTANELEKDVQIAFGMTRYCVGQSVEEVIESADKLMYEHKAFLKSKAVSSPKSKASAEKKKYEFPEDLKKAYESSPLSFVYYQNINDQPIPILVSEGFCRNTGMPRDKVLDWLLNGMFERMHPDDVGVVSRVSDDFLHQRGVYDTVFRCRLASPVDKKEEYVYIHGLGKWQTMPDGTELAVITYANLTNSQKLTSEKLDFYLMLRKDRFYTDPLTEIPNINYFNEFGKERFKVIRAEGKTPSVVFVDIYSMQSYNNQYGTDEGDKLLILTAKTLVKYFPNSLVSRDTDDHFVIICDIEDRVQLEQRLQKANRIIRRTANGNTSGIRSGVCAAEGETTPSEALDRAKMALKRIEYNMNREVEFFSDSSKQTYLQDRYIIENLDRAIKEGWIKLYYHSIFRVETKKIAAFECLARWDDPNKGMIYPNVFINVLLKYHLLYKLDLFMFEQACAEVKTRFDNGLPLVPVSVNFSRQDFDHVDVISEMNRIYDKYNLSEYCDKSYLVIEITEQDIEAGKETFKEQLVKIKENNYGLWLDDFGSGYSAISSFSQYEFDLMKFDMELVKNLNDKRGVNHILLEEMVILARKLGIHTLIEGAETQEQFDFIKQIGCELVQGYYFTKPEPLDEILDRVKKTGFIRTCEPTEEREAFTQKWFE